MPIWLEIMVDTTLYLYQYLCIYVNEQLRAARICDAMLTWILCTELY